MRFKLGTVRPAVWDQVSAGLFCFGLVVAQFKWGYAADFDAGWIALIMGGAYLAKSKACGW